MENYYYFAIESKNGDWWTGAWWGTREQRAIYASSGLPQEIDCKTYGLLVLTPPIDPIVHHTYRDECAADEYAIVASVRIVGRA